MTIAIVKRMHTRLWLLRCAKHNVLPKHPQPSLETGDHHHASELLRELGEEALEENGDCVLLHRERPLEVPHSG